VFIHYEFCGQNYSTNEIKGSNPNPNFAYLKTHMIEKVTPEIVEQFKTGHVSLPTSLINSVDLLEDLRVPIVVC